MEVCKADAILLAIIVLYGVGIVWLRKEPLAIASVDDESILEAGSKGGGVDIGDLKAHEYTKIDDDTWVFGRRGEEVYVGLNKNRTPYIQMSKWGEDTMNISIPLLQNPPLMSETSNRLQWSGSAWDIAVYPKQTTIWTENIAGEIHTFEQNQNGGVEFDIILKQKPPINSFSIPIDAENFDFYYQPALHENHPTWADEDNDNVPDSFRPSNVVGSYAIYHKTKRNHVVGEIDYMVGKAFHIYRPLVTDARGDNCWADLRIEKGILTISVDEKWLNSAVYPVTVDPNFGYENQGSSTGSIEDRIRGSWFTCSTAGTTDNITAYLTIFDSSDTVKCAIYLWSDNSLVDNTNEITDGPEGWNTFTLNSVALTADTKYWLCAWAKNRVKMAYDSAEDWKAFVDLKTYSSWPDPFEETKPGLEDDRIYSIYVSYTESAPPPAEEWQALENWTSMNIDAPATWSTLENWTSMDIDAPATWSALENWTGTITAPLGWKALENWLAMDITAPAAWSALENWTSCDINSLGNWSAIENWLSSDITAPMGWRALENWTSMNINAAAGWHALENWTGTINAGVAWRALENWVSMDITTSIGWRALENWASCTINAPISWQALENWTGSINGQIPGTWQALENWTGIISTPIGWAALENWTGSITVEIGIGVPVIELVTIYDNLDQFRTEWENAENATTHQIQIDNDNNFSSPFEYDNANLGDNNFTALLRSYRVYIRVRGTVGSENGEWSDVFTFNIEHDPSIQHLPYTIDIGLILYFLVVTGSVAALIGMKHAKEQGRRKDGI